MRAAGKPAGVRAAGKPAGTIAAAATIPVIHDCRWSTGTGTRRCIEHFQQSQQRRQIGRWCHRALCVSLSRSFLGFLRLSLGRGNCLALFFDFLSQPLVAPPSCLFCLLCLLACLLQLCLSLFSKLLGLPCVFLRLFAPSCLGSPCALSGHAMICSRQHAHTATHKQTSAAAPKLRTGDVQFSASSCRKWLCAHSVARDITWLWPSLSSCSNFLVVSATAASPASLILTMVASSAPFAPTLPHSLSMAAVERAVADDTANERHASDAVDTVSFSSFVNFSVTADASVPDKAVAMPP